MTPGPQLQGYPIDVELMRRRAAERAARRARRQSDGTWRQRLVRLLG